MKNLKTQLRLASLLTLILMACNLAYGQLTPAGAVNHSSCPAEAGCAQGSPIASRGSVVPSAGTSQQPGGQPEI